MDENLGAYIVLGVIVSVIVNILLTRIRKLIDIINEKKRRENEILRYTRPYNNPDTIQDYTTHPPVLANPHNANTNETQAMGRSDTTSTYRPPVPVARRNVSRTPDTFPKCPRCGCKNNKTRTNLVTWDSLANKWRCYNGHLFNS